MNDSETSIWSSQGEDLSWIVLPLIQWYQKNARPLPWRKGQDPYRIWVSEIMLQQSRVEAVKPYFMAFMERFPTLQTLADAPLDELRKLWEGLGYYSRANNLHKAAQILVEQYNGVFPHGLEQLKKLPGIGEYTAGAIASIAFNQPTAAVDGNVLRVVARLLSLEQDVAVPAVKKQITGWVSRIYPEKDCGTFTQGLMELGAMVCIPNGAPKCGECPLSFGCKAYQQGNGEKYPIKTPKKEKRLERHTVFLLCCGKEIALFKRPEGGLLGGLWQFPSVQGFCEEDEVREKLEQWQLESVSTQQLPHKTHTFTHIVWELRGYRVECLEKNEMFSWVTPEELDQRYSIPTAFRKYLVYWHHPPLNNEV